MSVHIREISRYLDRNDNAPNKILLATPTTFDPVIVEIFVPILAGGVLVIFENAVLKSPISFGRSLIDCSVSTIQCMCSLERI